MRPITEKIPKSMFTVKGKPFLQHQLELLKKHQIYNVVLCIGYLADQIKNFFKDGKAIGMNIEYSEERKPLGTAGALKKAEPLLDEEFLVMNGDSYLKINYIDIIKYFNKRSNLALMTVYKNHNLYENSNVVIDGDFVERYDRNSNLTEMVYVDAGLYIFRKDVLKLIPNKCKILLDKTFTKLIGQRELLAYEISQRFYEIGSMSGLKELKMFMGGLK